MNYLALIACILAGFSVIIEVVNENYIAANWAFCTAVWAGFAI